MSRSLRQTYLQFSLETDIPKHKALNFRNQILLNIKEYFLKNPNDNNNRELLKLGRSETENFKINSLLI